MRTFLFLGLLAAAAATHAADRPHVLLICVDDLRPELGCYGADYIHSPNIDRLAETGRLFRRHFVQAPTCGASRYVLLNGRYGPATNDALFRRARQFGDEPDWIVPGWPRDMRKELGYVAVSVGKVSHHPGGLGGPDWNDPTKLEMPLDWDRTLMPTGPWRTPRGAMHGLAFGETRDDTPADMMDVVQAAEGSDLAYPDGLIAEEALKQLDALAAGEAPFFLAVGFLKPHLPFGCPKKYLELYDDVSLPPIPHPKKPSGRTTWHGSGEFMKYDRGGRDPRKDPEFAEDVRRHYAACVSYADAQVGKLLDRLDTLGIADKTIVVLWGDHGYHLGEHAVWGKHTLFDESLHSPLIVRLPDMPHAGVATDVVAETIDVWQGVTACIDPDHAEFDLAVVGITHGHGMKYALDDPVSSVGDSAFSYFRRARSVRTADWRYIEHDDGLVELYDHRDGGVGGETVNVADEHPDVVVRLATEIRSREQLRQDHDR